MVLVNMARANMYTKLIRCALMTAPLLANSHAYAHSSMPSEKADSRDEQAMAQEFSSLKFYDAKGSPIRIAREDWPAAFALVNSDPNWKAWATARQQTLKKWMAVPRDHVYMIAGNSFKLLDPVSKAPVNW